MVPLLFMVQTGAEREDKPPSSFVVRVMVLESLPSSRNASDRTALLFIGFLSINARLFPFSSIG